MTIIARGNGIERCQRCNHHKQAHLAQRGEPTDCSAVLKRKLQTQTSGKLCACPRFVATLLVPKLHGNGDKRTMSRRKLFTVTTKQGDYVVEAKDVAEAQLLAKTVNGVVKS